MWSHNSGCLLQWVEKAIRSEQRDSEIHLKWTDLGAQLIEWKDSSVIVSSQAVEIAWLSSDIFWTLSHAVYYFNEISEEALISSLNGQIKRRKYKHFLEMFQVTNAGSK